MAITIAGVDSGGGAGIAADLKAFAAMGVHGTLAVTSVTAQNTLGVTAIHDLPPEMVAEQIRVVAEDLGIDAGKTGMLSNTGIIKAVAREVARYGFPLVVDPVMVAKSGDPLLREDAVEALANDLLPLAKLVTPNRMEAEKLAGFKIESLEDAKKAARAIAERYGAEAVIVKGGHLSGDEAVDVLYYQGGFREFKAPRVRDGCTHGTGCAFSAAIAAGLAKGLSLVDAIREAKKLITLAVDYGLRVGRGHCPVNPMAYIHIPAYSWMASESVERAVAKLVEASDDVVNYYPEVGINVVEALPEPYARTPGDVVGVHGRIVKVMGSLQPAGPIGFGASSHLARYVLGVMKYNPKVRAAVNVRYSEDLVKAAERLGFKVSYYDRSKEPPEVKEREGATIPWGVEEAVRKLGGQVPDVIYHKGDWGKEAMAVFLGSNAEDAVEKLLAAIRVARSAGRS
ncbi:bifunctional hydroxymethylpyrimidine kinase/phosphomethylpyrimidine kinase [Stetteria hydrogenophila]